jgi:hypothetical protein
MSDADHSTSAGDCGCGRALYALRADVDGGDRGLVHHRITHDWVATQPQRQPFCPYLPGTPQGYGSGSEAMMMMMNQ